MVKIKISCVALSFMLVQNVVVAQTNEQNSQINEKIISSQSWYKKAFAVAAPIFVKKSVIEKNIWEADFERFKQNDLENEKKFLNVTQTKSILFLGSSSIRMWSNLQKDIEQLPEFNNYQVFNRGFGGSTLKDCAKYTDKILRNHKPDYAVIYAGDNDLAQGATPKEVKQAFLQTYRNIKKLSPQTKVVYISIKPSPARANLLEKINESNDLIEKSIIGINAQIINNTNENQNFENEIVHFVDIYDGMIDKNGQPIVDLFLKDKLHMNEKGYEVWRQAISQAI